MISITEVAKRIASMSDHAKIDANIPLTVKFKCIGLSLSGCEQESTNVALENEIKKLFPGLAEKYVVCSDSLGSILTISNLGGVVVIAGTGSNAVLRNPNGGRYMWILLPLNINVYFISYVWIVTNQCGGWGHSLGDEGGAWWISHKGIKTVFDHEDNLQRSAFDVSTMWNLIKSHFNIENRADMLEHCYAKFQKSFFAKLCQKMSVAAYHGDELCLTIFKDAGRFLARMIAALLPKASPELISSGHLSVLCIGSVWISWELLKKGFINELREHNIPIEIRLLKLKSEVSPAVGSIYVAADSIEFPLPREYSKNYEIFFSYNQNDIANYGTTNL